MISSLFLHTMDPSIGRFDQSSLSDQTRMEIAFDGLGTRHKVDFGFFADNGEYNDFCALSWIDCDEDGRMLKVSRVGFVADGTVSLDFLPLILTEFRIENHMFNRGPRVQGTLNTEMLPESLESFIVQYHKLSGTVDLVRLPPALTNLKLGDNAFEGTCDLTQLPPKLENLFLYQNKFSGSVSLRSLPSSIQSIYMDRCQFSGELFLDNLPKDMKHLDVSSNAFQGSFVLLGREKAIKMYARHNAFRGKAIVCKVNAHQVKLQGNSVESVYDEHGERYTPEEEKDMIIQPPAVNWQL